MLGSDASRQPGETRTVGGDDNPRGWGRIVRSEPSELSRSVGSEVGSDTSPQPCGLSFWRSVGSEVGSDTSPPTVFFVEKCRIRGRIRHFSANRVFCGEVSDLRSDPTLLPQPCFLWRSVGSGVGSDTSPNRVCLWRSVGSGVGSDTSPPTVFFVEKCRIRGRIRHFSPNRVFCGEVSDPRSDPTLLPQPCFLWRSVGSEVGSDTSPPTVVFVEKCRIRGRIRHFSPNRAFCGEVSDPRSDPTLLPQACFLWRSVGSEVGSDTSPNRVCLWRSVGSEVGSDTSPPTMIFVEKCRIRGRIGHPDPSLRRGCLVSDPRSDRTPSATFFGGLYRLRALRSLAFFHIGLLSVRSQVRSDTHTWPRETS